MARKIRPSFAGIQAKYERAFDHFDDFRDQGRRDIDTSAYAFRGEIHREGLQHVYRIEYPPKLSPSLPLLLGDAIHNLRSTLDHLAYQLVLLNGGQPSEATQWPVRRSRYVWDPAVQKAVLTPVQISGGVAPNVLDAIEEHQPYHAVEAGGSLWDSHLYTLHQLDVIDKHRHLLFGVVAVTHSTTLDNTVRGKPLPEYVDFWLSPRPLKHGEVAARITYAEPYDELDPFLRFGMDVAFDDRGVGAVAGYTVESVLDAVLNYVEETINAFHPLFPEPSSTET